MEEDVQLLEELGKDNLNLLLKDDGISKVLTVQKEKEFEESTKEITQDNPARLNDKDNREIWGESEPEIDQLDTLDKEDKSLSSTKDIDNLAMDQEESREVFDDYNRMDYFQDNKDSMDMDKSPSPNDDYE